MDRSARRRLDAAAEESARERRAGVRRSDRAPFDTRVRKRSSLEPTRRQLPPNRSRRRRRRSLRLVLRSIRTRTGDRTRAALPGRRPEAERADFRFQSRKDRSKRRSQTRRRYSPRRTKRRRRTRAPRRGLKRDILSLSSHLSCESPNAARRVRLLWGRLVSRRAIRVFDAFLER